MLMFGEGAEVNKSSPQLLESLYTLCEIMRKYPPSRVYNMNETGLFHRLLYNYSLLMPNEDYQLSEEKRNQKIGQLWLYVLIQISSIRFCAI